MKYSELTIDQKKELWLQVHGGRSLSDIKITKKNQKEYVKMYNGKTKRNDIVYLPKFDNPRLMYSQDTVNIFLSENVT